jgi:hypothetical protein
MQRRKQARTDMKKLLIVLYAVLLAACAAAVRKLDDTYGLPDPARYETAATMDPASVKAWQAAERVLDRRCVVCHSCTDAPCRVSLGSFEGIARGASKADPYGNRVLADPPNRLFIDAHSPSEWRKRGFFPVLNERTATPEADLQASLLYRAIKLKSPEAGQPGVANSADAQQSCPTIETYDGFAAGSPQSGMPYGLPPLSAAETGAIADWLKAGAPHVAPPEPSPAALRQVARWEAFFNGEDLKSRLMSRYIYEHLFFAHIYFGATGAPEFFQMVRSKTPPGQPVDLIATRRPYDDPGVARVYYRLQPVQEALAIKTHMPYRLDDERMDKYRRWFVDNSAKVTALPPYDPKVASNPFATFHDIPIRSRYRFMLEEAEFTISGFVKGPVCRGQVALNVINDQFWVFFVNPNLPTLDRDADFLAGQSEYLRLPAESGSNAGPLDWRGYRKSEEKFIQAKAAYYANILKFLDTPPSLNLLWDGDGVNPNAALTIFRHFDQATVVQGLEGSPPKTAWLIGYPLLERIHYLLVAGFDIYGNVGHQINTRIYMDFMRMEGEANFIALLPKASRNFVSNYWYRGAESEVKDFFDGAVKHFPIETAIPFKTTEPVTELMQMLKARLQPALRHKAALAKGNASGATQAAIERLGGLEGRSVSYMPQLAWMIVEEGRQVRYYSVLHNTAHSNIAFLLEEEKRLLPDEDTMTVVDGLIGAYPNAFYRVKADELGAFVDGVGRLGSDADYRRLAGRFAVAATSPDFWAVSDQLVDAIARQSPIDAALPDYGRFGLR